MENQIIYLDSQDWLDSPCYSCGTYCCSNLPVCDLKVDTIRDLYLLAELSSFEGMVPVLKDNGQWRLFYNATCTFLHTPTRKCLIHNSEKQSHICRTYPPGRCWYRKAFAATETLQLIRFNTARIEHLITLIGYDQQGEIETVPDWTNIMEEMQEIAFGAPAEALEVMQKRESDQLLLFPPGKPKTHEHYDLLRFRLGFPGMMVLISHTLWCFALPALVKEEVPEGERAKLLSRLNSGVYDSVIVGIDDHERYLLRSGAYRRVSEFDDVPPLDPNVADVS